MSLDVRWLPAALLVTGCTLGDDDADRFREAIPDPERVEVPGPEGAGAPGASARTASVEAASHDAVEPWENGPWARYYGFTRAVRRDVNHVTAAVLGGVWIVVHWPPSRVDDKEAVWGPHTDALEPVTWRFRVREVERATYDYALEGRPKSDPGETAWVAVLTGRGYGKRHPLHGDGHFTVDLDAAARLDPFEHQGESGALKVTHALAGWPLARVDAELVPSRGDAWWAVTSTRAADGAGELVVNAHDDIDEDGSRLEDVTVASRWRADGAGRADVTLSGGDLPGHVAVVTAVECWDPDFYRSYYTDDAGHEPDEGDASACVFGGVSR